ncbi:MAG: serine hydrolase [Deltaproteobacteria bacterium]|nr:serine hydrolase [Deltaproteobacteria bacterium]
MPPLPAQPAEVLWPTAAWPAGDPESDVDRDALDRVYRKLIDEADEEQTGETHALLFVHRGRLVAEGYDAEHDRDSQLISWSMAKSITHALAGILIRKGQLDPKAPLPIPAWRKPGDPRGAITLEHLFRMVDGLDFVEEYVPGGESHVIEMLFEKGKEDVAGYAAARSAKHSPDTFWNYSSGTSNILSRILCEAVGGGEAGMRAFMERELFGPLGMRGAESRFDAAGTFIGSSYVFTTARNFARFGLLYLRDGIWDGERILLKGWVDHARRLTPASFDQYGAQWWLAQDGSGRFYASGFQGQYIVVDPARDLIMVRLGRTDASLRPNVIHALADAVHAFPAR